MIPKLTVEQRAAIDSSGVPLPIEDDETHRMYFLLDESTLESSRQQANRQAIRQGIADMEAGRVFTLSDLDERIRTSLAQHKLA